MLSIFISLQYPISLCHAQPAGQTDIGRRQPHRNLGLEQNHLQQPSNEEREPENLKEDTIKIAIGPDSGHIKPLLGINAGPSPCGEPGNTKLSEQYEWAGINAVRTHDFYGPLDLSVMFPDINGDPSNPSSYDFKSSDVAIAAILESGLEVYLRIGDSYNNVRVPFGERQRKNLIKAVVNIVRHYNKANSGSRNSITYIEIGNEPDNKQFWPTGFEDFLPFFTETFHALRKEFPDIKLGGPGFVVSTYKARSQRKNIAIFFDYLNKNNITCDFISFHLYTNDPAEYYDIVNFYRDAVNRSGHANTELHITEWNTEREGHGKRIGKEKDAAYLTACWIALQEAKIDASYLFRGNDTNINQTDFYGIFCADGAKKPAAHAFRLWSIMTHFPHKLELSTGVALLDNEPDTKGALKPLWLIAGKNDSGQTALLLSNIGSKTITYELSSSDGLSAHEILDLSFPCKEIKESGITEKKFSVKPYSIQLIKLKKH